MVWSNVYFVSNKLKVCIKQSFFFIIVWNGGVHVWILISWCMQGKKTNLLISKFFIYIDIILKISCGFYENIALNYVI